MQKILKNNRGSITLFVVLSVLFFLVIVTSVAVSLRNKESAVDAQYERVKAAYEKDVGNEKALYEEKAQYGTVLLSGKELNAKMKQLAGNSAATYETEDTNIKAIRRSDNLPDKYKSPDNIVSVDYSASPVYMWFYNETIYFYSSSEKIKFNKDSSYMFNNIKAATDIEIVKNDTASSTKITNFDTSSSENMSYLFYNCLALTKLDVSTFNTKMVTDMSYMFYKCSSLESLNVSNFNTSSVTNMSYMFYMDVNLTELGLKIQNVSKINTSNVTNMSYMFYECSKLTGLDVSMFNTGLVTDMSYMFYKCSNLTSLDVSKFNTSNVTNMSYMFYMNENLTGTEDLPGLDVSKFNTSKVTDMSNMFYNCSNLKSLDLSSFDMTNVTNVETMISGMTSLTKLLTPKYYSSNITLILPKTLYDYGENEYNELTHSSPTKEELRSEKWN